MERRWLYLVLVSLGCLEPRQSHARSAEQAPDTMEARAHACAPCHGAKGGDEQRLLPASLPAILRTTFSLSTPGAGTTRR